MRFSLLASIVYFLFLPSLVHGQVQHGQVLTASQYKKGPYGLSVDKGSSGLWFQLKKLQTTASMIHTTAHPDDEHAGLLTGLSRGDGVRTALLTINRGEGGANATGSELFDALGLVRTEELLRSGQYYGLDDQYFTTLTDYGYSKTLSEALMSWGREAVLEDMVRIIRMNRPLVVVSRFHGSERDGHGHHQAAGAITPEAFVAAGDPNRFTDQLTEEGLRPWKAFKLFRGGVQKHELHHITFDPSVYDPLLGNSYHRFGYYGLSLQRSQTSGRVWGHTGENGLYYEQLLVDEAPKSENFFEGLDISISGMYRLFDQVAPIEIASRLDSLEKHLSDALDLYDSSTPSASVSSLVHALRISRELLKMTLYQEVAFLIKTKETQIQEAINTALGIHLSALAVPPDTPELISPWSPLPTLDGSVPGDSFDVRITFWPWVNYPIRVDSIGLIGESGLKFDEKILMDQVSGWKDQANSSDFSVEVPVHVEEQARLDRPYFFRPSIQQNQYNTLYTPPSLLPHSSPALAAYLLYEVGGESVRTKSIVRMRRANLPNGYKFEPFRVLPKVSINASPSTRVVPENNAKSFFVEIEIVNNDPTGSEGVLTLKIPEEWGIEPENNHFTFSSSGERSSYSFEVLPGKLNEERYEIGVEAVVDGRIYTEGYEKIVRDELETQYWYKPASIQVQGVDVDIVSGLNVGYVMGVGDEVPFGIEQLGASVSLLGEPDLSQGNLSIYDVIVVGTRAYAVREDLINYNNRLLDFAREGGHLIVLYQTPEYKPEDLAPYRAVLPRNAEEVSEEDAPVTVLMPEHPFFHNPNTITFTDFDGWVEQRGSKFFASWDKQYEPLIEMHDTGQAPQRGAWLTASVGAGRFTYCALAIHRQTPFGIPGAYRILANMLSMGH